MFYLPADVAQGMPFFFKPVEITRGKDKDAQIPRVEPVLKEIEPAARTVRRNDGNHADRVENAETVIRPAVEMRWICACLLNCHFSPVFCLPG